MAKNFALGVRRREDAATHLSTNAGAGGGGSYDIGFYRSKLGKAEKWLIIQSVSNVDNSNNTPTPIQVGTRLSSPHLTSPGGNTMPSPSIHNTTTSTPGVLLHGHNPTQQPILQQQHPVRSGDAIILQNVSTGGLLVLDAHAPKSLSMLNKGFGLNNIVIPGPYETWQLLHVGTPPCPHWNTTRKYMSGKYLLDRDRHDNVHVTANKQVEGLFGLFPYKSSHDDDDSTEDVVSLGKQPLHVQERILLDEILGAMMGLEGTYIQAFQAKPRGKSNASSSPPSNIASQQPPINPTMSDCSYQFVQPPSNPNNVSSTSNHTFSSSSPVENQTLNQSLIHTLQNIFPLCNNYTQINEFVLSRLSKYEYGFVAQALATAIDSLLQEYLVFVCQMEHLHQEHKLTPSKLWCFVQPSMRTMNILMQITTIIKSKKGGEMLNNIHELSITSLQGEQRARDILRFVLQRASKPYLHMLSSWIYTGQVYDPFGEFMIDTTNTSNSGNALEAVRKDYGGLKSWDNCYAIRKHHVCYMFKEETHHATANNNNRQDGSRNGGFGGNYDYNQMDLSQKVLTTGKYLNVIRECVDVIPIRSSSMNHRHDLSAFSCSLLPTPPSAQEQFSNPNTTSSSSSSPPNNINVQMDIFTLTTQIEKAFDNAANTLLNLILVQHNLIQHLHSIKRYFLLDQGDFFVHFLDMAEDELLADLHKVSKGRVQSFLRMSIQSSSGSSSLEADSDMGLLCCDFARDHLAMHLDAIHSSTGGIGARNEPKTPTRHAYGMTPQGVLTGIEAFMLDYKVDWPLSLVLSKRSMTQYQLLFRHLFFSKYVERRLFETWLDHQMIKELDGLRTVLLKTYCLRQRMLHFMQNFVYYMMFEVIEPHWNGLIQSLKKVKTVDDVLRMHNEFQAALLKECLLTNSTLLRILTKLISTCLQFSDQMEKFFQKTNIHEEFTNAATEERIKRVNIDKRIPHKKRTSTKITTHQQREIRKQRIQTQTTKMRKEITSQAYRKMIAKLCHVFDSLLADLMTQIAKDHHSSSMGGGGGSSGGKNHYLSNLVTRLDYNEFISNSLRG